MSPPPAPSAPAPDPSPAASTSSIAGLSADASVPTAYPTNTLSTASTSTLSAPSSAIPVFDLTTPSPAQSASLVSAAATHGFLFIRADSTNIPPALINSTFALSRSFFTQPPALKAPHAMPAGSNIGWAAPRVEVLDPADGGDPKEAFNLADPAEQPLPDALAPALAADGKGRDTLNELARRSRDLCGHLLELLAEGLQVEGGRRWLRDWHEPDRGASGSVLRLLHYPKSSRGGAENGAKAGMGSVQGQPAQAEVRAGAHTDYGSLTLLFREDAHSEASQPDGLEVLTPAGTWAAVPVRPAGTADDAAPPVLVNVGDVLSFWTGGLLRSAVHRVAGGAGGADEDRYSIAFFCHPCREAPLEPVPGPVVRAHVRRRQEEVAGTKDDTAKRPEGGELRWRRYAEDGGWAAAHRAGGVGPPRTAGEHLQRRLHSSYGWA